MNPTEIKSTHPGMAPVGIKIEYSSDEHLEFDERTPPETDADVLVFAGDIHTKGRAIEWFKKHYANHTIIYVLGNHDLYGGVYPKLVQELKQQCSGTNIYILERDTVEIDGVNFLGCTLWTDFALFGNPRLDGAYCQNVMTDFKKIRRMPSYSKLRSIDAAQIHRDSLLWLGSELERLRGQKNIVVTHHAPSAQSLPDYLATKPESAAYASHLDEFIESHDICAWIHGHIHHNSNYRIGNTQVCCNPRGYAPDEINPEFSVQASITV